ncbi:hypothetical protein FDP41_005860 [Naegleria fowleri]|uniref:Prolyl endopeptidase n=1 Tax=Naegleria fowleri TaxID=5763 RepID=A0A6A5BDH1_NAEFO|nr:uncharacterized protein FDP41_005860 [Naegleria fowleri]KAF0975107.1 hypothetical protein FDP41_005860 [Naegleria fowleri]CAG4709644.1 unnamed protein product [Naegleria fowleri]
MSSQQQTTIGRNFHYPQAFRDTSAIDTYQSAKRGEVKIEDPYRWLEEPYGERTKEWVNQQVQCFADYMKEQHIEERVGVTREQLKEQITNMVNFEKVGCPFKRGEGDLVGYYFFKNDGLQNQDVLWVRKSLESAESEIFVDPNKFSADGTSSIRSSAFSKKGDYYAYGLSERGSDWQTIHVIDVKTKQPLKDQIKFCKFTGIAWTHDSRGFFYSRYPEPKSAVETLGSEVDANEFSKLYYHKLGTPQDEDILIYEEKTQPKWMFGASVTDDGKYLLIYVSESTAPVNRLFYTKIYKNDQVGGEFAFEKENPEDAQSRIKVVKYIDNFDAEYDYIANDGDIFYFKTNLNAPNSKVVVMDVTKPYTEMKEILAETEDPLSMATCVNKNILVANYVHNVQDNLKFFTLQTGEYISDIQLPVIGSISSLSGRREDSLLFYKFVSFNHAGTIYRYDFDTQQSIVFYQTKTSDLVPSPESIEVKQEWYSSKDGTKIPMFIVHNKKGFEKNGKNPCWLYGYGGFSINLQPSFSIMRLFWIKYFGGMLVIPNLRGGAEIGGEKWHEQGILDRKQNVFDDMIAAAEYIIKEGYTSPPYICLNGGSNGGLLVAACINQRPDLFGAAVPQVGVLDMLKFHTWTIGAAWCSDYGCSSDSKGFDYLIEYSPLHNIKAQKYPAVLVTTANHDDRVVPHHSFKYTAQLQHVAGPVNEAPLLIRIETSAGHGAGKSLQKVIEEMADIYLFVANEMGIRFKGNN